MCYGRGLPGSVTEALVLLDRALDHLNAADVASLPTQIQAEALRALGRAEAKHTAAQARVLGVFAGQGGFEDDGHGTARTWLKWQTRVTTGAAAGAIGWARRLMAHPAIERALAAGELSPSWARQICGWTDRLPDDRRDDADEILVVAARGGASLAALAGLAQEIYERCAPADAEDGFEDRWFRLGITFRGAGRAEGDLTPGCAAALAAVLEALGKKAGPEDVRTGAQRRHDALEEACRRLIRAGMVPARAGQPTQVLVHLTLAQLRGLPGAPAAEDAWAAARASQPGWLTGPEADAALCDATIVPVVTGHVDWAALDQLTDAFLLACDLGRHTGPPASPATATGPADSGSGQPGQTAGAAADLAQTGQPAGPAGTGQQAGAGPPAPFPGPSLPPASTGHGYTCGGGDASPHLGPLSPATRDRLRRALLGLAADALSGPEGLAARLRATLHSRTLTSISLPLDTGAATETIPAHLRRAATTRHPHCAFPGCDQPATVCDIHHLIPRARGGPTSLHNLVPLCSFHHLTAIHRWGWTLALHSDGTTTATSPDHTRTLMGV
ncbi:MAG TPA: DUF222 domain-containing protein [Streptosporangiaceae bacterium]|nr:DUF222 domain-containing protein [Streptosporangiaceae bacterium]